jgi:hypothetical protein
MEANTTKIVRKTALIPAALYRRLDEYRWAQRIPSDSEVMIRAMTAGLEVLERETAGKTNGSN